jgi:VIT1/CCC1 family predicted Fe2+/Mn2+ transporter
MTKYRHPIKIGLSFGLTSGTITTLGLIVGLYAGTDSKLAILGGIFTIAIADAFADALGIHISEESENKHTAKQIWVATLTTWAAKFVFALSFAIPVLLLPNLTAIIASSIWGLILLGVFSFVIAKTGKEKPWKVISEHLFIAILVIVLTFFTGKFIAAIFR